MGRLSKAQIEFKRLTGMTPLEFHRMIRRQVGEKIEKRLHQQSSE